MLCKNNLTPKVFTLGFASTQTEKYIKVYMAGVAAQNRDISIESFLNTSYVRNAACAG
jgi:hypothetical protein